MVQRGPVRGFVVSKPAPWLVVLMASECGGDGQSYGVGKPALAVRMGLDLAPFLRWNLSARLRLDGLFGGWLVVVSGVWWLLSLPWCFIPRVWVWCRVAG